MGVDDVGGGDGAAGTPARTDDCADGSRDDGLRG